MTNDNEEAQPDAEFYAENRLYDEFERKRGRRPLISEKMYRKDFGVWPAPDASAASPTDTWSTSWPPPDGPVLACWRSNEFRVIRIANGSDTRDLQRPVMWARINVPQELARSEQEQSAERRLERAMELRAEADKAEREAESMRR